MKPSATAQAPEIQLSDSSGGNNFYTLVKNTLPFVTSVPLCFKLNYFMFVSVNVIAFKFLVYRF